MKNYSVFTILLAFIVILLTANAALSQYMSINPPEMSIDLNNKSNFQEFPQAIEIAVNTDADNWTINCLVSPFISQNNNNIIPLENLLIKQDYTQNGNSHTTGNASFKPVTPSVFIANGSNTAGQYNTVNQIFLKLLVPDFITFGNYVCEMRFIYSDDKGRNEEMIVNLYINFSKYLSIIPHFHAVSLKAMGGAGYKKNNKSYNLDIVSNYTPCDLVFELSPIVGLEGQTFNPENIFLNITTLVQRQKGKNDYYIPFTHPINYTIDFNKNNKHFTEKLHLNFDIETSWTDRAGQYTGTLKISDKDNGANLIIIPFEINILPANTLRLSAKDVYFHAKGEGAIWDGDKPITLYAGSNCGLWSINCNATDLVSIEKGYLLPNKRLFIHNNIDNFTGDEGGGIGYYSMDKQIELFSGSMKSPQELFTMDFRLKTTDTDRPGKYCGKIVITQLAKP